MCFCIVFSHIGTLFCADTLLPTKSVSEAEKNEAREGGGSSIHAPFFKTFRHIEVLQL